MEFRTIVDITKPDFEIQPLEPMLLVGSCFADNLGKRFRDEAFPVVTNPYGVMYNPASILHSVKRFVNEQKSDGGHTPVSTAVLTLGTNHVYIEKTTNEIVDNCRKRPQALFREEILGVDDCYGYLKQAIETLRDYSPHINIIITVSPIRYRKYGYHGSQLSKATLMLAADNLATSEGVTYFPAYEILNDELRDYRFYQPDMLHPSQQAVEYVWERFAGAFFSEAAKQFLAEWKPVKEALGHRPAHPDSEEYKAFVAKTNKKIAELQTKYPKLTVPQMQYSTL